MCFSPSTHTRSRSHTRYEYVESQAWHGGVRVTYKDRLSRVGTSTNTEWAPIEKVSVPGPTPGSAPVEKTVTCKRGINFIPHPPDLRLEPTREDWVEEKLKEAADNCHKIGKVRHATDLTGADKQGWHVLGEMLRSVRHSGAMPSMPHTACATGSASTAAFLPDGKTATLSFDGSPCPLIPILSGLMRFKRPLITWDVFKEPPPASFEIAASMNREHMQNESKSEATEAVRDPRMVNNVVHKEFTNADWKRSQGTLSVEAWLDDVPERLERDKLRDNGLYLVKIDEADGEFCLGLVKLELDKSGESITGWWFARKSSAHSWPSQHVPFERYMSGRQWLSDPLEEENILLAVEDDDLTSSGLKEKDVKPTLSSDFMKRVRLFAARYGLECKQSPKAGNKAKKKAQGFQPAAPNEPPHSAGNKNKKKAAGSQPEVPNRPKRKKVGQ